MFSSWADQNHASSMLGRRFGFSSPPPLSSCSTDAGNPPPLFEAPRRPLVYSRKEGELLSLVEAVTLTRFATSWKLVS